MLLLPHKNHMVMTSSKVLSFSCPYPLLPSQTLSKEMIFIPLQRVLGHGPVVGEHCFRPHVLQVIKSVLFHPPPKLK
ncbi:hypothetical protein GDO81_018028 [Engystomops pustulosus]|uniref:Uncharacterized protein n=1 Tax=Engystomops pustulosus TaxID=76066 RepID=A0AAV7AB96_ENGPU|nr:hypothetical protein GDO81_018028 [Engystomops pustulosus]